MLGSAKLEYAINKTFKFGGGYAGYKFLSRMFNNGDLLHSRPPYSFGDII